MSRPAAVVVGVSFGVAVGLLARRIWRGLAESEQARRANRNPFLRWSDG